MTLLEAKRVNLTQLCITPSQLVSFSINAGWERKELDAFLVKVNEIWVINPFLPSCTNST